VDEDHLQAFLDRLPPECREVLVLRDMEGKQLEAIAETLGLSLPTVRNRLQRARLELRELLQRREE
jgi:RNA polymerase sigma-70 factor (ECF subfamily)